MTFGSGNQFLRWGSWVGRLILGSVFIYAASLKMTTPNEFADSIAAFQILPFPLINPLASGLPLFEFACGLMVLTGFRLRVGVLGILGLSAVFTVAIVTAQLRGLSIDCGCFGRHAWLDSNPWIILIRDGILLGLSVHLYVGSIRECQN